MWKGTVKRYITSPDVVQPMRGENTCLKWSHLPSSSSHNWQRISPYPPFCVSAEPTNYPCNQVGTSTARWAWDVEPPGTTHPLIPPLYPGSQPFLHPAHHLSSVAAYLPQHRSFSDPACWGHCCSLQLHCLLWHLQNGCRNCVVFDIIKVHMLSCKPL